LSLSCAAATVVVLMGICAAATVVVFMGICAAATVVVLGSVKKMTVYL